MRLPRTRILYASLLALFLSLTLARVHPFGDAGLFAAPRSQPPQLPMSIPPAARAILAASCADCHSTPARAPFYGHFAPISWLLERDILQARKHLNLSQWNQASPDQQQVLLAEIAQQARSGHMPPALQYLPHPSRRAPYACRDLHPRRLDALHIRRAASSARPRARRPTCRREFGQRKRSLQPPLHRLPLPHGQPRRPAPRQRLRPPLPPPSPALPFTPAALLLFSPHHLERPDHQPLAHRPRRLPPRQQHGLPRQHRPQERARTSSPSSKPPAATESALCSCLYL